MLFVILFLRYFKRDRAVFGLLYIICSKNVSKEFIV